MAKSNLLNTRTANFQELVGNGRIYRVPRYQRDYSWEEEHWDDLWADVTVLRGHSDESHYMGALVVEGRSDREFNIIDGQQRLATLSILALAIIHRLRQLADSGHEPERNIERATALRSRFIKKTFPREPSTRIPIRQRSSTSSQRIPVPNGRISPRSIGMQRSIAWAI